MPWYVITAERERPYIESLDVTVEAIDEDEARKMALESLKDGESPLINDVFDCNPEYVGECRDIKILSIEEEDEDDA